ncbi:RNA-binding protein, CCR4-NOT complex subunit Rcd1 [Orobanche hederae]
MTHIPLYLYPFLNTTSISRPFEYLRLTSLGVIGALVKPVEEIKANFINVSAASITLKWLEKTSNALLYYAKKLAPIIIYLDEVDSLLGARGKNETSILKGFVAAWDGLESQRVLVIGGTNRPFDIDEAVICRLSRSMVVYQ